MSHVISYMLHILGDVCVMYVACCALYVGGYTLYTRCKAICAISCMLHALHVMSSRDMLYAMCSVLYAAC